MNKPPLSVRINLVFMLLNALIWLGLGLIIALHAHPALPDDPLVQAGMAFLSLCAAGILLVLAFWLWNRIRLAWFAGLGFLALTCILTLFDDFGWTDLLVLVINLVPLLLLIKDRDWYRRAEKSMTCKA